MLRIRTFLSSSSSASGPVWSMQTSYPSVTKGSETKTIILSTHPHPILSSSSSASGSVWSSQTSYMSVIKGSGTKTKILSTHPHPPLLANASTHVGQRPHMLLLASIVFWRNGQPSHMMVKDRTCFYWPP